MSIIFASIINREAASASASTSHFEEQRGENRKRKAKATATSRSKSRRRRHTDGASANSDSLSRRRGSNSSLVPELVSALQTARAPNPPDMAAPLDMTLTCSSDDDDDKKNEIWTPYYFDRLIYRNFLKVINDLSPEFRKKTKTLEKIHKIALKACRPIARKVFRSKLILSNRVFLNLACPCGSRKKFNSCCGKSN